MRRILTICVTLMCLFDSASAQNDKDIHVIAMFPIPLMIESENEGLFVELTRSLAKRANIDIRIEVNPAKRSLSRFMQGQVDGLFPALDSHFPPGYVIAQTEQPVYVKQDFAFTRIKQPTIKNLEDLNGLRVGITRGYPYGNAITQNPNISLDTANSDELGMQKLVAGRIDAFIVEKNSGLTALRHTQLSEQVHYDPQYPISSQPVFYAFQHSENGKRLAILFSNAFKQMQRDGSFETLFMKMKR